MADDFNKFWFHGILPQPTPCDNSNCSITDSIDTERSFYEDIQFPLIEEKKKLAFIISQILEKKKKIMAHYQQISDDIDAWIHSIQKRLLLKKQELKEDLKRIGFKRVAIMNLHLKEFEDYLQSLNQKGNNSLSLTKENGDLVSVYMQIFNQELEFLNNGMIQFSTGDMFALKKWLHTGRICIKPETNLPKIKYNDFGVRPPKFVIGCAGSEPGQFCRPWGVCADSTGRILVSDRSNNRIQVFDENGRFLFKFGKSGSEEGEFNRPAGIFVDRKCRIIVADKDNHRIQIFTYTGHFLLTFGKLGSNVGKFNFPWDVAANSDCEIAVSDFKNNRIQLFSEDGEFKALLGQYLSPRTFQSPRSVSFLPNGSLLTTDFNNHRVVRIYKNFRYFDTFGKEGENANQFNRPQGVASYESGEFVIADSKNYRIQAFSSEGQFLYCFGAKGSNLGEFDCPQGVAIHPNGNIIVVDLSNNRVQVF